MLTNILRNLGLNHSALPQTPSQTPRRLFRKAPGLLPPTPAQGSTALACPGPEPVEGSSPKSEMHLILVMVAASNEEQGRKGVDSLNLTSGLTYIRLADFVDDLRASLGLLKKELSNTQKTGLRVTRGKIWDDHLNLDGCFRSQRDSSPRPPQLDPIRYRIRVQWASSSRVLPRNCMWR